MIGESFERSDVQAHRYRGAAGERLERDAEATLGEYRRMDTARDLLELLHGCFGRVDGAIELCPQRDELGRHRRLSGAQLQAQRDEPLLGAVVHVAFDPPARL